MPLKEWTQRRAILYKKGINSHVKEKVGNRPLKEGHRKQGGGLRLRVKTAPLRNLLRDIGSDHGVLTPGSRIPLLDYTLWYPMMEPSCLFNFKLFFML